MPLEIEDLAKKTSPVTKALAGIESVKGVLCFGSAADGTADSESDVDLYVLCQPEIPTGSVRLQAFTHLTGLEALQIDQHEAGWDQSWCPQNDQLCVYGLWFELSYNTLDYVEGVVRKVRGGVSKIPEMPFRPYTLLGLLEGGVPLHDPAGWLARLQEQLTPYPPRLKQHLLSENMSVARGSLSEMVDIEKRQIGNRAFHFHLERCCDAVDSLLFALNERYDPAAKRVEVALKALPVLPADFHRRYQQLLETPLTALGKASITREMDHLLEEIEGLVKTCG